MGREGGRTVNVHVLVATASNADGYRQILGLHVTSAEDGAGWLAFCRQLVARGLTGGARPARISLPTVRTFGDGRAGGHGSAQLAGELAAVKALDRLTD